MNQRGSILPYKCTVKKKLKYMLESCQQKNYTNGGAVCTVWCL